MTIEVADDPATMLFPHDLVMADGLFLSRLESEGGAKRVGRRTTGGRPRRSNPGLFWTKTGWRWPRRFGGT